MTTQAATALTARIIEEPGRFTLVVIDEAGQSRTSLGRLILTIDRKDGARANGVGVRVPTLRKAGAAFARLIARSDDYPRTMDTLAALARSRSSHADFVAMF